VEAVRAHVGTSVGVMAVVKANAYGHGTRAVAKAAVRAGATSLGVATVEEGRLLRAVGLTVPILVLGPIDGSEYASARAAGLAVSVGDLDAIAQADCSTGDRPLEVHLKVDTGMRRFGAMPAAAVAAVRRIVAAPSLRLGGVFTHFACADEPDLAPTASQAAHFDAVLEHLRESGVQLGCVHAANTAALLHSHRWHYDQVRLGIGLYGLRPSPAAPLLPGMKPALTILSKVRRSFHLRAGDGVGYGATFRAKQDQWAALVPIGYADGYSRLHSNRAWMAVEGRTAPVLGRVSMDQTVVGVGDSVVPLGTEVVVAGPPGNNSGPDLDELAAMVGTINYEVASALSPRVPRFYVRDAQVVAIETLDGYSEIAPSTKEPTL